MKRRNEPQMTASVMCMRSPARMTDAPIPTEHDPFMVVFMRDFHFRVPVRLIFHWPDGIDREVIHNAK